jgi:DNA-binding NtrC family response regulator
VLVADDQPAILDALSLLLGDEGFAVETARAPQQVVAAVGRAVARGDEFDAALLDLNYARDTTSGREGLDLLEQLQSLDATLPVVVMTAWGSVEGAVEAMRRGARDYVEKPWDDARLTPRCARTPRSAAPSAAPRARGREPRPPPRHRRPARPGGEPVTMIAESAAMRPVLRLMERVGPSDAHVLVTGEHGTGKELVARWLHAASPRAGKPLVVVNMGGLSDGVFESELFGHVKGAFTDAKADRVGRFELADTGTLFLDELGQHVDAAAEQAAARAAVGRGGARGLVAHAARRRAGGERDQRRPARRRRGRPLPRGPALPPQHGRDPPAAAARAPRGHPAPRRAPARAPRAPLRQGARRASPPTRSPRCSPTRGPGNVRELGHAVERACSWPRAPTCAPRPRARRAAAARPTRRRRSRT